MKNIKCVETGSIFGSFKEAALYANLFDGSGISKCCRGAAKTAGGFHWEYTDESVASNVKTPNPAPAADPAPTAAPSTDVSEVVNEAADRIVSEVSSIVNSKINALESLISDIDDKIEELDEKIAELEDKKASYDEAKARKARDKADFKYRFKSFMRRWRKRIALDTVEGGMLGAAAFLLTFIPGMIKFSILTSSGIGLGVGFVFAVAMCIGAGIKNGIRA